MSAACTEITIHHHRSSSLVHSIARLVAVATGVLTLSNTAMAFQIAPMSSAFESKLTNETENSLHFLPARSSGSNPQ